MRMIADVNVNATKHQSKAIMEAVSQALQKFDGIVSIHLVDNTTDGQFYEEDDDCQSVDCMRAVHTAIVKEVEDGAVDDESGGLEVNKVRLMKRASMLA